MMLSINPGPDIPLFDIRDAGGSMPYIGNTDEDRRQMLEAIGVSGFEELLRDIPAELRLRGGLDLPPPLAEPALNRHLEELAALNRRVPPQDCYLGGGAYVTHIPEAVSSLAARSEFITAYTPYQAEVSQGTLQAIFEFQTMICCLTDMEVANASMYDGATAMAEAMRMAASVTGRRRLIVSGHLRPRYRSVIRSYFHDQPFSVETLSGAGPAFDAAGLEERIDEEAAAVVIQSPNRYGTIEDVAKAARLAREKGALLIQDFDPLALGLFQTPGEAGADIAVGEGQSISQPLQFGGPYLGLFAGRKSMVKQMPGRLIGATRDAAGERGFVLTFQTREQHIRREKATSNICTNQALMATCATIHMALLGPRGLRDKARALYTRASWLAEQLERLPGAELLNRGGGGEALPCFREFALRLPGRDRVLAELDREGILGGLPLDGEYGEDGLLVAVNEFQERADLERYIAIVRDTLEGGPAR